MTENDKRIKKVIDILSAEVVEMEGYSHFGSNPGIPEDEIEELAKQIVESLSLPSVIGSCTWDKLLEGENLEHKDGYYCEECFYIGYHPNKEHTVYCPCCGRKINYR